MRETEKSEPICEAIAKMQDRGDEGPKLERLMEAERLEKQQL